MASESSLGGSRDQSNERKLLTEFAREFFRIDEPEVAEDRRKMLERLSKRQRRIVRLHYFESLPFAEIGEQLALEEEQVEAAWFETLDELRSQ
jgi:RNA polymerase sigma factor (sigma-70 family)